MRSNISSWILQGGLRGSHCSNMSATSWKRPRGATMHCNEIQERFNHFIHHENHYRHINHNPHRPHQDLPHQPGTVAYAAGWGAIIPDDQLGPLAFLIPKAQKRPTVLQVRSGFLIARDLGHKELKSIWLRCLDFGLLISARVHIVMGCCHQITL